MLPMSSYNIPHESKFNMNQPHTVSFSILQIKLDDSKSAAEKEKTKDPQISNNRILHVSHHLQLNIIYYLLSTIQRSLPISLALKIPFSSTKYTLQPLYPLGLVTKFFF